MTFSLKTFSVATAITVAAAVPSYSALRRDARDEAALPRHARYEVSITNLTRGQIMSPAVVATHNSRMDPIFTLGSPASRQLAMLAEDAVNAPMIAKLKNDRNVFDVLELKGKKGPIMPGETAKVVINGANRWFNNVSLLGMLVTTNDAFYALNGAAVPRHGSLDRRVPAYDSGTEANNEKCAFIPGPPCGHAMVRDTAGAEGYVHIHAGIHGIGDLKPAQHDWRNPVARIRIRRVR